MLAEIAAANDVLKASLGRLAAALAAMQETPANGHSPPNDEEEEEEEEAD
jgi:hypothetical protein